MAVALILAVMSIAGRTPAHEIGGHPAEVLAPMPSADRLVSVPGDGLFVDSGSSAEQLPAVAANRFIKRWRKMAIDSAYRDRMMAASSPDATTAGVETFKLNLFDDTAVTLFKTAMRQDNLGSTIWTGRVTDGAGGEVMLVSRAGFLSGTVRFGDRVFMIEPASDGAKIVEIDPDQRPHADPRPAPAPPAAARQSAASAPAAAISPTPAASGSTVINIMVAYTPAAARSVLDIQSAISIGIAYTNMVLANSGINAQLNLVGAIPVNYAENGEGYNGVLTDAQNGVGDFSNVHTQRDVLKADLVSVWSVFTDACGVGYQLDDADQPGNSAASESEYGYNAISLSFGTACLTDGVAHEIGHNLGAAHDRYIDDPTDKLTSRYNFGYVDITDRIRTIMSYPDSCTNAHTSCTILPYHSSPNLTYLGHSLGLADSAPNAADNVRRINEIVPYIARFRSAAPATTPLLSSMLPASRSIQVGHTATFYMSVLNIGSAAATNCVLEDIQATSGSATAPNDTLTWQTTNPATNAVMGTVDQPFTIPGGAGSQTLFVSTTVTQTTSQALAVPVVCDNADPPALILGVNSIFLTVDSQPRPDTVALVATVSNDGILHIFPGPSAAFALATVNVGASGDIVVSADTGSAVLPLSFSICETTPAGVCMNPPSGTVLHSYTPNQTASYAVFATTTGSIGFNPATTRIFIRLKDASGGTLRGSTSVAVETQ